MHRRLWRWPYTARKDTYRCPWLEKAPSTLAGGHFLHIWRHLLQAGAQDTNGSIYIGNCVQFKDGIARDSCTRLFQHATPPKNCEQGSRRGSQNIFFVLIFWWSVYLFYFLWCYFPTRRASAKTPTSKCSCTKPMRAAAVSFLLRWLSLQISLQREI